MIVFPNAKINLGLHIIKKRPDGFHDIETVFYPVPLTDALEVIPSKENGLQLIFSGLEIAGEKSDNIIVKAYNLLRENYGIGGLKVHLHKSIPMGAGLGGGSSDAAFFLRAASEILDLNLTFGELHHYARLLGSDCSFFINNKPSFGTGKGEQLETCNLNLKGYYLVLVKPEIHISTVEAYAGVVPKIPEMSIEKLIMLPVREWQGKIVNDFEKTIFNKHPELNEIKNILLDNGAIYSAMSGSGSTVYGLFNSCANLGELFKDSFYFETILD